MKKVGLALVIVLIAAVVVLGGAGHLIRRYTSPDYAELERLARCFLQDLKFKDFSDAGKYHAFADQAKVNIPQLIEKTFAVKPEQLNIRDFRITGVDVDDTGTRARTQFRTTCELLNTARGENPNEERQIEGILYWHKLPSAAADQPAGAAAPETLKGAAAPVAAAAPAIDINGERWFMKLESSLPQ